MQFAEDFLTSKKGDPQHNPTVRPSLTRVPGNTNSKCAQEVKVLQRWDGQRPVINYLLRDFRRWLINEKIKQRLASCRNARIKTADSNTIWWIEKLLQTPLGDYSKLVVWRILALYLITIENVLLMRLLMY